MHPLRNTILAHEAVRSDENYRMLGMELQPREADRNSEDLWLYVFENLRRAPSI